MIFFVEINVYRSYLYKVLYVDDHSGWQFLVQNASYLLDASRRISKESRVAPHLVDGRALPAEQGLRQLPQVTLEECGVQVGVAVHQQVFELDVGVDEGFDLNKSPKLKFWKKINILDDGRRVAVV